MEFNQSVFLSDTTLRDGNHAISHQLTVENIKGYCTLAENAGVPIVEVGHGNGLGASSLQVGLSACSDREILETARNILKKSKLGIHVIPGFATIEKDLLAAIEIGVDVFRIASHCTEADITKRHIMFCHDRGKTVFGVLMMSHMASVDALCEEAKKMEDYGAEAVIIMDSAGAYLQTDVIERIESLRKSVGISVGFHAHNNLGMGIANTIAAVQAGASIIDGSARGFGAGAGNAQLEVLVAVLEKMNIITNIDFYKLLDACDYAEQNFIKVLPTIKSLNVVSGLAGVFSGFEKPVIRISHEYCVDPREVFRLLGKRKVVAGQEDLILEVAQEIKKRGQNDS